MNEIKIGGAVLKFKTPQYKSDFELLVKMGMIEVVEPKKEAPAAFKVSKEFIKDAADGVLKDKHKKVAKKLSE